MLFFLSCLFFLQQNLTTRGLNRFCPESGREREGGQKTMYTHVNKCKNDKRKKIYRVS
jgi:hypothetical protein